MVKKYDEYLNEAAQYEEFDTDKCQEAILKGLDIKPVFVTVTKGDFLVKEAQIRICYNETKDYPNGLAENAPMFIFRYFFGSDSLEAHHSHFMIWLSPYDKEHDHKYMAMRSAENLGKECGVPYFRKCKGKDETNIANKITKYVNTIMDIVMAYTGGYPYKDSKLDISIKDAYKK